ncbi:alpha/beta fold hydrolase [Xanthovirga aplysinae]|uniref:alpha/beta fold hydrolase n=1 Tax=Xanthovirga aplysinae TaxID=2529853 RepID=UPI0012BBE974|nr:alpha/beta hydrolase [Xanthovirga aplysinae]MTI33102.1 alpha/beta hydrolase [Xanthovirga aplysinae]
MEIRKSNWGAVKYQNVELDGVKIFYREAGASNAPTLLLLHGFPTSSHMFRDLIPALANEYHIIAPDYPGFGYSEQPPISEFDYSFDNFSRLIGLLLEKLKIQKYSLYVMDYGAPVGYRLFAKNPEKVQGLIIQNGNAYEEGLKEFWDPIKAYWKDRTPANAEPLKEFISPKGVKWQYTHGVKAESNISPDNWIIDRHHLDRPENPEIQLALFYDYRTNIPLYPNWQAKFREHQPPALIVWGKNDYIFPAEGAHPYKRDLRNLKFHLLDTGHFALEEEGIQITKLIREFMENNIGGKMKKVA